MTLGFRRVITALHNALWGMESIRKSNTLLFLQRDIWILTTSGTNKGLSTQVKFCLQMNGIKKKTCYQDLLWLLFFFLKLQTLGSGPTEVISLLKLFFQGWKPFFIRQKPSSISKVKTSFGKMGMGSKLSKPDKGFLESQKTHSCHKLISCLAQSHKSTTGIR